ncbi:hypothetical protein METBIDRAFT_9434 [Metschnikowia bicuspidata var. bicuspidata NRRL YB-4993]|uniref:Uncharacterized protein n=1 Tax=Metschnikowia bicuspidata var. bicuspidata NRRL YB-4993 TaxID=869754 RepID=A0A1A0HH02_9ASCO|nr:hypothetical protein METBIDRAFT_9434 [Metschnikowia bicuspidata var. bicuspidata NRRL YB-4993]OBA23128.1 hypothetical protein METBIDRAFT_9434 [Metschnikowia bicuspidata var. bicuspidata NRRL YB-4993]
MALAQKVHHRLPDEISPAKHWHISSARLFINKSNTTTPIKSEAPWRITGTIERADIFERCDEACHNKYRSVTSIQGSVWVRGSLAAKYPRSGHLAIDSSRPVHHWPALARSAQEQSVLIGGHWRIAGPVAWNAALRNLRLGPVAALRPWP